ncbi:MAG: acylphosphatase [Anaerolineales bacterium]
MANSNEVVQVHVFVRGLVQGVGFRYFVQRSAVLLDVMGWTRNLPDGRVEIVAEGRRDVLERFLADVQRGPARSRVIDVAVEWGAARGGFDDFGIRG